MAKEFIFVPTKELGTAGNYDVTLGHYKADGKEYADKIYIFETYTKKDGTEVTKSIGKFSPKEFAELQKIDISDLDTEVDANEVFD